MHTLARLAGFGVIVTPRAPFRLDRVDGAATPSVLRIGGDGGGRVVDPRALLDAPDPEAPVDVFPGDAAEADWWIETGFVRCRWPAGFGLASDPEERCPFLLLGPEETMVWLEGPFPREKATPIEKLVAPGQTLRAVAEADDAARVDIDYEHDGEPWWQRRYAIAVDTDKVLLATGQARRRHEELVRAAVDLVEHSLERTPTEAWLGRDPQR